MIRRRAERSGRGVAGRAWRLAVLTAVTAGVLIWIPVGAGADPRPNCSSAGITPNGWQFLPGQPTRAPVLGAAVFEGAPCAFIAVDAAGAVFVTWDTGRKWSAATTLPFGSESSSSTTICMGSVKGVVTENLAAGSALAFGAPRDVGRCPGTDAPAARPAGMFRTTNFGLSFEPVTAFAGLAVLAVSASPTSPNLLVALVDTSGAGYQTRAAGNTVYTSSDGGDSWSAAPAATPTMPFGVAAGSGPTASIWLTTRLGSRWAPQGNPLNPAVWHSASSGAAFAQVDEESSISDITVRAGPGPNDQVNLATGNGIVETRDDGASWRRLSPGTDFATLRTDAADAMTMMAVSEGVPVRSRDGGRTFSSTAGLAYLGSGCRPTLTRNKQGPSLFVLLVVAPPPPIEGAFGLKCDKPGVWIYQAARGTDGATPASGAGGSGDACPMGGPRFGLPDPPNLPDTVVRDSAPLGTVIYVSNFDGTCLVRLDRYGNAEAVTALPPSAEGIALDFDGSVIVTTRFTGRLLRVDAVAGSAMIMDPRANPVEGPAFDRWGNLFATLNNSRAGRSVIVEYPFPQEPPDGGRRVIWSFGRSFVEDVRIAPPRSPFSGDLFVLYSTKADSEPDAVARLRRTASGWTRLPDFIPKLPSNVLALGMAFAPDGSLLLPDWNGSGQVLRFSPDGTVHEIFATVSPEVAGESYSFNKIDVTASGFVYITSGNNPFAGGTNKQNTLVRLDPAGRHLLPDFNARMTYPVGVAVPNVITGLPRLVVPNSRASVPPAKPGAPQRATLPIAPVPLPPGPPVPLNVPISAPAPAAAPAPGPAAQANANPLGQAQANPVTATVSQRQEQVQVATAQVSRVGSDGQLTMSGRLPRGARDSPAAALALALCAGLVLGVRTCLSARLAPHTGARVIDDVPAQPPHGRDSAPTRMRSRADEQRARTSRRRR